MKCNCCDNKIWVENGNSNQVELFTRKRDQYTGVVLTREDAIDLAFEILRKLMSPEEIAELAISEMETE